jgi:hypothetical protein
MADPGFLSENSTTTNRVEVTFQVLYYPDGQPFIALVFSREGEMVAGGDKLFSFDLAHGTTADEAATIAQVLNRCVTHLAMTFQGSA